MAGVSLPTASKRAIDAQLNMVPFIDLLSVLISFLLMTSVWSQVARGMDVKSRASEAGTEVHEPAQELAVQIAASGYTVTRRDGTTRSTQGRDVVALGQILDAERALDPTNARIELRSDDGVEYEAIIEVMDVALERGLRDIAVGEN